MANFRWCIRGSETPNKEYPNCLDWKADSLQDADKWICEQLKIECDPKQYSQVYTYCVELAFATLMRFGSSGVEKEHVDFMMELLVQGKEKWNDAERILAHQLLQIVEPLFLTKYYFEAWR